jgi:predicted dehydrogenase
MNACGDRAIRVGVVGIGYLGRFHVEKYRQMEHVDLVGLVEADPARAQEAADRFGLPVYRDHRELIGRVDAVSIAVPTPLHYAVAKDFLLAGVDVLVEKPITTTLAQAEELIALAEEKGLVLQVGHLERFNPAVAAVRDAVRHPLFIESHRLSIFQGRCTDVSVVLDLMIHDIDIILTFVGAEVKSIHASGAAVVSEHCDIANARIEFTTGCVANITASRISMKNQRKMRLFQPKGYVAIDFASRAITVIRQTGECTTDGPIPGMTVQQISFDQGDALAAELVAFTKAVRERTPPAVTGRMGHQALNIALRIMEQIDEAARAFGHAD